MNIFETRKNPAFAGLSVLAIFHIIHSREFDAELCADLFQIFDCVRDSLKMFPLVVIEFVNLESDSDDGLKSVKGFTGDPDDELLFVRSDN